LYLNTKISILRYNEFKSTTCCRTIASRTRKEGIRYYSPTKIEISEKIVPIEEPNN